MPPRSKSTSNIANNLKYARLRKGDTVGGGFDPCPNPLWRYGPIVWRPINMMLNHKRTKAHHDPTRSNSSSIKSAQNVPEIGDIKEALIVCIHTRDQTYVMISWGSPMKREERGRMIIHSCNPLKFKSHILVFKFTFSRAFFLQSLLLSSFKLNKNNFTFQTYLKLLFLFLIWYIISNPNPKFWLDFEIHRYICNSMVNLHVQIYSIIIEVTTSFFMCDFLSWIIP